MANHCFPTEISAWINEHSSPVPPIAKQIANFEGLHESVWFYVGKGEECYGWSWPQLRCSNKQRFTACHLPISDACPGHTHRKLTQAGAGEKVGTYIVFWRPSWSLNHSMSSGFLKRRQTFAIPVRDSVDINFSLPNVSFLPTAVMNFRNL